MTLTGREEVPLFDGTGPLADTATKRVTTQGIADLGGGGGTDLILHTTGTWSYSPVLVVQSAGVLVPPGTETKFSSVWLGGYGFVYTNDTTLTSLEFTNLAGIMTDFNLSNMAALTSIDSPVLTSIGGSFLPSSMAALTSLSLPALVSIGGDFSPNNLNALTSLDLPALVSVGGTFNPNSMDSLTSFDLPVLTSVGDNFNPSSMDSLISFSLPFLASVGSNFSPRIMASLTSLDLPSLISVGNSFNLSVMASLTSLDLPSLISVGNSFNLTNNTDAITTLTIGSSLRSIANDVACSSCALDQASVDGLLVRLAALDGTGGTTSYDNHSVQITGTSASPGAVGLAAKATLEGRGNTVTVN